MKIEHQNGFHDDLLFSYLIGMYALLYCTKSINKFVKNVSDLTNDEKSTKISKNILRNANLLSQKPTDVSLSDKIIEDFNKNHFNQNTNSRKSKINAILNLNK